MAHDNENLYVLVCERDTYDPESDSRAIVLEQFADVGAASLESVKTKQAKLGDRYGKTRIAKLLFID